MKRLHFARPNNLSGLHDEFLVTIPALAPVRNAQGVNTQIMMVEGDDNNVWITVPDDANDLAIGAVVLAHDPNSPRIDPAAQRQTRIEELLAIGRSNWTAGQINELLELVARNS